MTLLRAVNNMTRREATLSNSAWPALVREGMLAKLMGYADRMPPKLKRIIKKAINPVVADRYSTAAALRQGLERLRPTRRWICLDDNEWICTFNGREECAFFQPGFKPAVVYTIGGSSSSRGIPKLSNGTRSSDASGGVGGAVDVSIKVSMID